MLKSTAGGGGIGMRRCANAAELARGVRRRSQRLGPGALQATRASTSRSYVERARHVEVQIFGDGRGQVLALGERDCSVQRRNQKVIEETPAPGLSAGDARARCSTAAVRLGRSRAATARRARSSSSSTRATEPSTSSRSTRACRSSTASPRRSPASISSSGWCARRPASRSAADARARAARRRHRGRALRRGSGAATSSRAPGVLTEVGFPPRRRASRLGRARAPRSRPSTIRCSPSSSSRGDDARRRPVDGLRRALDRDAASPASRPTSPTCARSLAPPAFAPGDVHDRPARRRSPIAPTTIDVHRRRARRPPCRTTPAASATGHVGCPAVGADGRARRSGSPIAWSATPRTPPASRCTLTGPTLRFQRDAVIALAGAPTCGATLDGAPVPRFGAGRRPRRADARARPVRGRRLPRLPRRARRPRRPRVSRQPRRRSRSGGFGGHGGRALPPGDVLAPGPAGPVAARARPRCPNALTPAARRRAGRSACSTARTARPTSSPTTTSRRFFATGVEGPLQLQPHRRAPHRPEARAGRARDGGEAGLHPSNIHDNAYAVGTIDFTGDMPIILGPDGPSLGGFVCPATIVARRAVEDGPAQARRHACASCRSTREDARRGARAQEREHRDARGAAAGPPTARDRGRRPTSPLLRQLPAADDRAARSSIGRDGDDNLLVEYGPPRPRSGAALPRARAHAGARGAAASRASSI